MKRFWRRAEACSADRGWQVRLDGKPLRVPGGATLEVPSEALAAALAAEWDGAQGEVQVAQLPLTRLAGTVQERIATDPAPVVRELARWAETDLLSYRATHPDALVAVQAAEWNPWLDWAARRHGARLAVTAGVVPIIQAREAVAALAAAVATHDPWGLGALGVLVPSLGSLVLGLAVAEGALEAAGAHRLATLDEIFQERRWGVDTEAAERRRRILAEIEDAARMLTLVRG
ncbi:MAG: ATPase [Rhodospirillales bacterium]|nr:ATPase [Rhodospirillales bacterium]